MEVKPPPFTHVKSESPQTILVNGPFLGFFIYEDSKWIHSSVFEASMLIYIE